MPGRGLEARVEEEDRDVGAYGRLAQARAEAGGGGGDGWSRSISAPEATRPLKAECEGGDDEGEHRVARSPLEPRGQHRRHEQGPEGGPHAPRRVKPRDASRGEVRRREGVDARVDGTRAESGHEAAGDHHWPGGGQGVADGARHDQTAAGHEEATDPQATHHRTAGQTRGQVAHHRGGEQDAEPIERKAEGVPQRRPSHAQDRVGQAQADEGHEGQAEEERGAVQLLRPSVR